MQNRKRVRILSPYCNKLLIACLASLLLISCSGKSVRTANPDGTESKPAEKLPRDYDKALVLMQSGDYQAAIPVLDAFIAKRPKHAGPYINLGIAHRQSGNNDAAQTALNKAIELNPSSAEAHHQLGILYREKGEFTAALAAYNKALKLDPDYGLAHRNIGILYDLYLQQPGPALKHYKRFLELEGDSDADVNRWVVDLERRSGSAQASAAP
jgi:tetratricopeptide (TPR) repeat protein